MAQDIKRLTRSKSNRILGGVAAGIGEYLDADPTLIRLIFALSFLLGGSGILIYLVMWLIIPEESDVAKVTPKRKSTSAKKKA
ncbi:MAG: PspC domain-containing protein [Anaerolineales bacterium]